MGKYLIAIALLLVALPAFGQQPRSADELPEVFTIAHSCSASGSACVWTIQQPASGAKNLRLVGFTVYCSAACTFTQERNGTAASGSTITPTKVNTESSATPTFTAHHTSGSTGGTSIGGTSYVAAGVTLPIDLTNIYILGSGTTKNFTVRTSSFTGTGQFVLKLEQYQ